MRNIKFLWLGLLVLPTLSAKADDLLLREDVDKLKDDMIMVQRQLYREKNDTTAPQESVSNIQVRLGEYDQLIRDMNGKVENIEYRLSVLEKKIETFDKDIELRFEQMKKHTASESSVSTPPKNTPTTKVPPLSNGANAKTLYEEALKNLKENKDAEAETKFAQILANFPTDALAGNAQYWLGEVYYKQQNFAKAAVAFKDGYSKFPEGTKGPDCLLKLGLSMKALGKKEDACTAFVNLPVVFNKANSDISNRAKKEAEALGCK